LTDHAISCFLDACGLLRQFLARFSKLLLVKLFDVNEFVLRLLREDKFVELRLQRLAVTVLGIL